MKTNLSSRLLLALLVLGAVFAGLSTNAEAGNRRSTPPPDVTTSTVAPAISNS